jgi:protein O-GlcNAc transferase
MHGLLSATCKCILKTGKPTLISLNSSKKITDEMLLIWKGILERRNDAQLFIHVHEEKAEDAIISIEPRLVKLGLPLDRIIISPRVPLADFMASGNLADVALDTSPVSGGTTTLHTLWMGLPPVTLQGHDAVSSSTASTLRCLGLERWIAHDKDEYINHVVGLLDNPEELIHHRANIRDVMQKSSLMNYREQCIELEGVYRRMWMNYLLSEKKFVRSRTPCDETMDALLKTYESSKKKLQHTP